MTKASDKYTDPELRDEVKEEIQQSDKGGAPGQWSARKAQMMAKEYKERGGGYKTDKKDDTAKHLDQWTKEEWQTKEGDENARTDEGTHRYLPKKAWDKMDEKEKEATDKKKMKGSKEGEQYVGNTDKARDARKEVSQEPEEEKSANQTDESPNKKQKKNDGSASADKKSDSKAGNKKKQQAPSKAAASKGGKKGGQAKQAGQKRKAGDKQDDEEEEEEEDNEDEEEDAGQDGENDEEEDADKGEEVAKEGDDDEDEGVEDDLDEAEDDEDFDPEKADEE